ncbi:MAG TPA: hypothetical protein VFA20_08675 [Myxococcaceae bacterium]|nr:hypothetical protein [Myxococcaceae bacterium]
MTSRKPEFMAGDRKKEANGSIRLDAIWRNVLIGLAMMAGGICTIVSVSMHNQMWLYVGMVMLPLGLALNRRRQFVFDVPKRALLISGAPRGELRRLGFDEIRTFDLVSEKENGPWILTVNDEALCLVQRTFTNQGLKAELTAVLGALPAP